MSLKTASSTVQAYYSTLESRIGYRLFLGGTRHFGYYFSETAWPWPVTTALRSMEAKLLAILKCSAGARVLDAGCGAGFVAIFMAQIGGFNVEGIDLTPHHITKATQNVQNAGLDDQISVRVGDYHDLHDFQDDSFDGIYTMETLVHSTDPEKVLREFYRLLKPGGRLAMHEYDHLPASDAPSSFSMEARQIAAIAGLPAFEAFELDDLKKLAIKVGYEDVELSDISNHIAPMLWLFYVFALIPYLLLSLFGLHWHFVNTVSGVAMYRGRKYWRYVQVSGRKPE